MKRVLLAEDSSVIQNLTKKILEAQGYEVVLVKNGKEAVSKIDTDNFDLILLDINMPIMNGLECAKVIRSMNGDKSQIPIITITGNAINYSEEDFKEVGINDYLQKPLNFDLLVDKVQEWLNK